MARDFQNASHEELALMAQMGDGEAAEYLIRQYREMIRRKARKYFIMGAESEDVIQEAMIGLFKAIKSYRPEGRANFRTYAQHCIHRQILDAIKAATRQKHEPLNTSLSLDRPASASSDRPLAETIPADLGSDPEVMAVLTDIMEYISENEDHTFSPLEVRVWADHLDGRSYGEIARALGKDPKAIYNARQRMQRKLREFLKDS